MNDHDTRVANSKRGFQGRQRCAPQYAMTHQEWADASRTANHDTCSDCPSPSECQAGVISCLLLIRRRP